MSHSTFVEQDPHQALEVVGSVNTSNTASPTDLNTSSEGEYDQLRRRLSITTVMTSLLISGAIAWFYPIDVVTSYGLGSLVGLAYLRMLGRGVARLGATNRNTGTPARLGLFAVVIIISTQLNSLQVLPVFLGFITFKAALFIYAFQTLVPSRKSKAP